MVQVNPFAPPGRRSRYDRADFEGRVIQTLLPNKPRGVPRVDDRRVLNGFFWRFGPVPLGATCPSGFFRC
jgi:hypothetical protein